jgi:tetratricopeptide (TPR) repeat protein
MSNPWISLQSAIRRHPRSTAVVVALLVCLGVAVVFVLPHVRAELEFHAAKRAFAERKLDRAAAHLRECLQTWPDSARAHFLAAQVARRAGHYDRAEEHLSRCQELGWPIEAVGLERSMMQVQQGVWTSDLKAQLRAGVGTESDAELILEALAEGFLRRRRFQKALESLDVLLERQPKNAWALLRRGRANEGLNRPENAETDYRRLLEIDPNHDEARLRLAQVLVTIGKPKEARQRLESLWDRKAGDRAIGLALAKCLEQLGGLEESGRLLNELATKYPTALSVLIARGRQARQRGHLAEAEACFRAAVAQAPHDYDANYSLWQTLQARGKEEDARKYQAATREIEHIFEELEAANEQIENKPDDADLRCRIGVLHIRMGQDRAGLDWLASVLTLKPHHVEAHRALAAWYADKNQADKAAYHRHIAEESSRKTAGP